MKNKSFLMLCMLCISATWLLSCKDEDPAVLSLPESVSVIAAGGEQPIEITANVEWIASVEGGATWCHISPTSGTGAGTIKITIDPNPSTTARAAQVTAQGGGLSARLSVNQAGKAPLIPATQQTLISSSEKYCQGSEGVTLSLSNTQNGVSYQLYKNGAVTGSPLVGNGTPKSFTGFYTTGTYTAKSIVNDTYEATDMSGTPIVTASTYTSLNPGGIGTDGQVFVDYSNAGEAATFTMIPSITEATGGDGNIHYQWYKNGNAIPAATLTTYTPSLPATIIRASDTYTRKVSDGTCNITPINSDGEWVVTTLINGCANTNIDLGKVGFASTTTWTISSGTITQTWSDAVTATYCDKTTYSNTSAPYAADCRTNEVAGGNWMNWCLVDMYKDQLCPNGWRVPNVQDFINLDIALGGTGLNRSKNEPMPDVLARYIATSGANSWGGKVTGYCNMNGVSQEITNGSGQYWGNVGPLRRYGYVLNYFTADRPAGSVNPQNNLLVNLGLTLRCVR